MLATTDGGGPPAPPGEDDRAREGQEVVRLRRRLERERAARVQAENIGERATADLYASLQELRQLNDQQDEAMRRLRELDHAKDAFLSTVSHELRTPLTSMIAYLEMIEDGDVRPGPQLGSAVEVMSRNARRLQHLVEELLTFSALEHHGETMVVGRVDLVDVVEDADLALRPMAAQRGLTLLVEVDGPIPKIDGDRALLERVVLNLVNNAIKFTPSGGRATTRLSSAPGEVVVEVVDTGIGIPADEQHKLFARFFRSSRAVAEEIQGTGLGLALVRSVVERHHGSVSLSSVEGEGTTVTVRLPLAPV